MIGRPGQWPWKKGSLYVTFFRRPRDARLQADHPVDQEERVAMRQGPEDLADLQGRGRSDPPAIAAGPPVRPPAEDPEELAGQLGVERWPDRCATTWPARSTPHQGEVAQEVEDLVAGALVAIPELVADRRRRGRRSGGRPRWSGRRCRPRGAALASASRRNVRLADSSASEALGVTSTKSDLPSDRRLDTVVEVVREDEAGRVAGVGGEDRVPPRGR